MNKNNKISEFSQKVDLFSKSINYSFLKDKEISIFGAGSFGLKVYKKLLEKGLNIVNFYDNDNSKHNTKISGIEILDPMTINDSNSTLIIASLFASEIAEELRKNGYSKRIIILDSFGDRLDGVLITQEDTRVIKELYNDLIDEDSKEILSSLLQYRIDGTGLIQSDYKQYFHSKIQPSDFDIMIDGGAYNGDLIRVINNIKLDSFSLHCFEPDDKNFNLLNNEADNSFYNISTNKFGLWSDSREIKFLSSDEIVSCSCKVVDKGDISIHTISIDEYAKENGINPTYIKLDVEGAEYETLIGAKEKIIKSTPKLAISVYHKFKDLWELYFLIKSINPNYKFYLGHHTKLWYETILYAEERK